MAIAKAELDGRDLKEALSLGQSYLEEHVDELNALNVYPVPDGDTGINMLCTMRSATEALEGETSTSAAVVSAKAARGALLGARGNSGVILSQILMGIAKGLEAKERFSPSDLAESFRVATEMAYKAVIHPVEGTILTVISEVTKVALQITRRSVSFRRAMAAMIVRAEKTVEKTPEMLPVLKDAGVVDSGAKGLLYVLHGMKCFSRSGKHDDLHKVKKSSASHVASSGEAGYGFECLFLLEGKGMSLEKVRARIMKMGESVLVVGDETLLRVHVHTPQPDDVLDYARTVGEVKDIVVESLDEQVRVRTEKNKKG